MTETDPAAPAAQPAWDRPARVARATPWVLLVAGILGFIAAFELIVEKVALLKDPDHVLNCDINPVLSCGSVINTAQAEVFGFPNPIIGIASFAVLIAFGVLLLARVELPRWIWLGLNAGALLGIAFVGWLVWQSLYSIGALCPWCMVVWAATIPVFWQVTADNLASGRLRLGALTADIVVSLRWVLVGATYLVIGALIFVRWTDFWLGR